MGVLDKLRAMDQSRPPFVARPELLLHPQIPKPLHGVNPRTILGKTWWDIQKKESLWRNWNRCAACGTPVSEIRGMKRLEAHEIYEFDWDKGSITFREVVSLCKGCHSYIHQGRMQSLVDQGKMSIKQMNEIMVWGRFILKRAGYKTFEPQYPRCTVRWSGWHMVLNGEKYFSLFKNREEWEAHYICR